MRFLPLASFLLATACVPLGTPITDPNAGRAGTQKPPEYYADKTLKYQDYAYSPDVRSVQCYVATGQPNEVLQPPIVPLGQSGAITLEFDVLGEQSQRFTAKLIHCDVDWQPSILTDMQFLNEINEFLITDYRVGTGTKTPYFHYRLRAPQVKISGNYLLVVQNQGGAPVVSRRLLVYENQVSVGLKPGIVIGGKERFTMQQLDFSVGYGAVELVNPAVEVKVVLRQNFRWDNAKYNLRPTFVRDADRRLEYQYFNFENAFPGLSEYRFFDTRSVQSVGIGVLHVNPQARPVTTAELLPETSRALTAYNQYVDANGQRVFESREYGNGATNADYFDVTFQLKSDQPAPGPVYAFGAFSDWQLKDEYKLTYDEAKQLYSGHALLKQGYYNYDFAVGGTRGANETYFEGSHYETENQYDLLVYYRPPGTRADLLIGYQMVDMNSRQ
ncbi:type IX secretion system plug protein [Hymenobacter properus]|uniref:DUF5103 domain-containing protein n=1 Tax=Hymenobacter properus TaxID=2791026 RepID=A0A931FNM7_9BACT|nr:DUF5103 domain-containing protein [Hymenobacter properus]MBF9144316.1 DUF5103 domain-containing protein [Hymenobacter properus]MBR7723134.1 DUF5103 domain-containing protein [Microvirga sp. SRT04]